MTVKIEATPEAVARHYDYITPLYEIIGSRSLHFGHWPPGESGGTFGEAQQRFTELLIGQLACKKGQRVLDVGCGLGEPATRLARSTGCMVEGITLSPRQAAQARRSAEQLGTDDQTAFRCGDARSLPFPDGAFDAAWAVESLFHMSERARVLREVARVLRPGGRLLIADIVVSADATPEDRSFLQHAFVAPDFLTAEDYPAFVRDAGFEPEQLLDVSQNVLPTFDTVAAALQTHATEIRRTYSEEFHAGVQAQWARIAQIAPRCMRYIVLTATHRP